MGFSTLHLTLIFLVQNSQNHLFVLFDTMISWPKNTVPRPHLLCIRVSFANVHCRDACYCLNWETCFVACYFLNEGHHSSTWEFWNIPSMVVIKIGTCIGSPKTGNMALLHGRHAKRAWMRWDILCKRCRPLLQWFFVNDKKTVIVDWIQQRYLTNTTIYIQHPLDMPGGQHCINWEGCFVTSFLEWGKWLGHTRGWKPTLYDTFKSVYVHGFTRIRWTWHYTMGAITKLPSMQWGT